LIPNTIIQNGIKTKKIYPFIPHSHKKEIEKRKKTKKIEKTNEPKDKHCDSYK